jgi:hypothetical protein
VPEADIGSYSITSSARASETESALLAKMIGIVAVARLAAMAERTRFGIRFKHGNRQSSIALVDRNDLGIRRRNHHGGISPIVVGPGIIKSERMITVYAPNIFTAIKVAAFVKIHAR